MIFKMIAGLSVEIDIVCYWTIVIVFAGRN